MASRASIYLSSKQKSKKNLLQPTVLGNLKVVVLDGMELEAKDATGTSDPFCVLYLFSNKKGTKQKTKYINGTLNPNWGESFTFPITEKNDLLVLECYDKDFLSKDFIGNFSLSIADFFDKPMVEKYYSLSPKGASNANVGKIRLQILFEDISATPRPSTPVSTRWKLPNSPTKLHQVIQELLTTEEAYVDDLRILQDRFMGECVNKKLLKPHEIYDVFANLRDILDVNEMMISECKMANSWELSTLLTIFEKYVDLFDVYVEYCSNQSNASLKMEEYSKLYPEFGDFIGMTRMEYRGLNAEAFVVKPLQRLVKYPLLLRELKSADKENPHIPDIERITEKLNVIISKANEETKRKEQLRRISTTHRLLEKLGVYHKLVRVEGIYHSFVYSSRVSFLDINEKDEQARNAFLIIFEDFLLVACMEEGSQARIYYHVPLLNVRLTSTSSTETSKHRLALVGVGRYLELDIQSVEEKQTLLTTTHNLQRRLLLERFSTCSKATCQSAENAILNDSNKDALLPKVTEMMTFIKKQQEIRKPIENQIQKVADALQDIHQQVEPLNRQVVQNS